MSELDKILSQLEMFEGQYPDHITHVRIDKNYVPKLKAKIAQLIETEKVRAWKLGRNDEPLSDCNCPAVPITHNHLPDDGQSHNIRPQTKKEDS